MMNEPLVSDPLVSGEVDCTDLDGFMLNVERLMASELVALSSHEVIGAALLLWCRAWKQRPAASLPNDEKVIAAFARMPLQRFRKLRAEVMRGFVLCSDGRLYHSTLAREAINAYERKMAFHRKRNADAERLRKWRSGNRKETTVEARRDTHDETRFVQEGQGQGQGQGQGHINPIPVTDVTGRPAAVESGSSPPGKKASTEPDPVKEEIWAIGRRLLEGAGMTREKSGQFLGKLIKDHGQKLVLQAVREGALATPAEPSAWLVAALQDRKKPSRHQDFSTVDYREGVGSDGRF